jgi:hypothetical protein
MTNIGFVHRPLWQLDGGDWHLMIGNRSVAQIIPNSCDELPHIHWLSIISDDYPDYGCRFRNTGGRAARR